MQTFHQLYVITSKIQKFIKSQPHLHISVKYSAVCNHIKDTKIHQITTPCSWTSPHVRLYVITSKIQKFIKSQRSMENLSVSSAVCNHIKDTKIHQITTVGFTFKSRICCM